jgi:hypothetical protein
MVFILSSGLRLITSKKEVKKVGSESYDLETGFDIGTLDTYVQRQYELQQYEKDTIDAVKEHLENRFYDDRNVLLDHYRILTNLLEKLQGIKESEIKTGLPNWQLAARIEEIKRLCSRLAVLIDFMPKIRVYRSM